MKVPKQLIDCLNENKVTYEILHHPEAVTAQRIAQAEHVKGRHHAKVVMVKSGEEHLMMVLPADHLHHHFDGDPNLLMEWFLHLPSLRPWFEGATPGPLSEKSGKTILSWPSATLSFSRRGNDATKTI